MLSGYAGLSSYTEVPLFLMHIISLVVNFVHTQVNKIAIAYVQYHNIYDKVLMRVLVQAYYNYSKFNLL